MLKALLLRWKSSEQGTLGTLFAHNFQCRMLELPWRENRPQVSCIPEGVYLVNWYKSPKFGWVYHVEEVSERSGILIHAGNLAGDVTKGFKSHSHGCLLPCGYYGRIDGQTAGLLSGPTVRALAEVLNREQFTLEVRNA